MRLPIDKEQSVSVHSNWDSGTHIGFHANVEDTEVSYGNSVSIDKVLTKRQIQSLEYTLLLTVRNFIKQNQQEKDND